MREKILSVTLADCDVQTFRSGGPGGQHQNKTETGVRVVHRESGARGEARDSRSQYDNKRQAFLRMTKTREFQNWLKVKLGQDAHIQAEVERDLWPDKLKTEVFEDGHWVEKQL